MPAKNKELKKKPSEKKKEGTKKNKDATFILRLDRETRDEFTRICNELDTSAAREIRRHIKKYIKKYQNNELPEQQ